MKALPASKNDQTKKEQFFKERVKPESSSDSYSSKDKDKDTDTDKDKVAQAKTIRSEPIYLVLDNDKIRGSGVTGGTH